MGHVEEHGQESRENSSSDYGRFKEANKGKIRDMGTKLREEGGLDSQYRGGPGTYGGNDRALHRLYRSKQEAGTLDSESTEDEMRSAFGVAYERKDGDDKPKDTLH